MAMRVGAVDDLIEQKCTYRRFFGLVACGFRVVKLCRHQFGNRSDHRISVAADGGWCFRERRLRFLPGRGRDQFESRIRLPENRLEPKEVPEHGAIEIGPQNADDDSFSRRDFTALLFIAKPNLVKPIARNPEIDRLAVCLERLKLCGHRLFWFKDALHEGVAKNPSFRPVIERRRPWKFGLVSVQS